ncbi:LysR substrate-binding domain-containing protein [Pseudomonas sp. 21LCFQ010]|uniref:LysR substrate-binding domain-containing protein n=1 Tax=Pseudomonas sp. 21LCFQ010 TaxID=2957506 RepID=UPI002096ECE1|nr:LysR substrate-binding domain-containing protein [Pseudomonas sp. 21LCFQ010]MCO8163699.1 LysR substrate-binding domain-containing protein [Pseudomonas sp. 21LCFQ010]
MDLESLRIFDAVAAELSITRAAARLGRAASNVTTRIQQLEAELATELFIRSGKRIALSPAGQQFLSYARRMLALEDEARQMLNGSAEGGSLRVGSMESTAASRLPEPLAAYSLAYPQTRLLISTGPSVVLLEQLRQGLLDCAFVALPEDLNDELAMATSGLQGMPLWQEQLLLLLPASEAEVQKPAQVRTRTLAAFKSGCTYRALAEQALQTANDPRWQFQELGSYHAMLACVAAGAAVTVLPRSVLQLCQYPVQLPTLDLGNRTTWLVWRRGYATPAFERFAEIIRHHAGAASAANRVQPLHD